MRKTRNQTRKSHSDNMNVQEVKIDKSEVETVIDTAPNQKKETQAQNIKGNKKFFSAKKLVKKMDDTITKEKPEEIAQGCSSAVEIIEKTQVQKVKKTIQKSNQKQEAGEEKKKINKSSKQEQQNQEEVQASFQFRPYQQQLQRKQAFNKYQENCDLMPHNLTHSFGWLPVDGVLECGNNNSAGGYPGYQFGSNFYNAPSTLFNNVMRYQFIGPDRGSWSNLTNLDRITPPTLSDSIHGDAVESAQQNSDGPNSGGSNNRPPGSFPGFFLGGNRNLCGNDARVPPPFGSSADALPHFNFAGGFSTLYSNHHTFPGEIVELNRLKKEEIQLKERELKVTKIVNTLLNEHTVSPNDIQNNSQCRVCLEPYVEGESVIYLPCIHFYHKKCISDWFQKRLVCPECLSDVEEYLKNTAQLAELQEAKQNNCGQEIQNKQQPTSIVIVQDENDQGVQQPPNATLSK